MDTSPVTAVTPAPAAYQSGPKRLNYTHEAMVDLIIADPTVTTAELAELFGYSPAWIRRVAVSDSFQARLAERKGKLVDPFIAQSLDERLKSVTIAALEKVNETLSGPDSSASYALDALGMAAATLTNKVRRA